nr:trafficking protein particle complex subunit 6A isoform X2 [Kogia breviceps]
MDGDRVCVDHPIAGPQHGFVEGQKTSLSVLEGMGFRVGQALGERLPRETLAFREELDVLKFLCKDVWAAVFHKQMDSLRTNHQGTYVLQDNSFPLLIRMASGLQYLEEAPKFLAFTCGLLRGTLSTLGLKSLVTASVAALPASCFPRGTPAWRRQPLTMTSGRVVSNTLPGTGTRHPGASPVWTLPGSATCCLMWVSTPTSELYTEAAADPNGRRRGLLSGWGSSADSPCSPSPAHTAEHQVPGLPPCICTGHSLPGPLPKLLLPLQSPAATSLGCPPHPSGQLLTRLAPAALARGAPRQPCPALPPCLLVYVPPRFPLGPSGSLSWVLALSGTEPADVSQTNCSHSAKLCACGRGGGSGGSAQPCPQEAQGCPGGSPPDSPCPHSDTPAWPP